MFILFSILCLFKSNNASKRRAPLPSLLVGLFSDVLNSMGCPQLVVGVVSD